MITTSTQKQKTLPSETAFAIGETALGIGASIYGYRHDYSTPARIGPLATSARSGPWGSQSQSQSLTQLEDDASDSTDSITNTVISNKVLLEDRLWFTYSHHRRDKRIIPNWEAMCIAPRANNWFNVDAAAALGADNQLIIDAALAPSFLENTDPQALAQVLQFRSGDEISWPFISDLFERSTIPTQHSALVHLCSMLPLRNSNCFYGMGLERFLPIVRKQEFKTFLSKILYPSEEFTTSGAMGYTYWLAIFRDGFRKQKYNQTIDDDFGNDFKFLECQQEFVGRLNEQRRLNYVQYLLDNTQSLEVPKELLGIITQYLPNLETIYIEDELMRWALEFTNPNDLTITDLLAAHQVLMDTKAMPRP